MLSATDAVAATALLRDIGAPRRVVTLLESESVFNDATALVAYQAALGAAATASFSPAQAGTRILVAGLGGILVGLAVGLAVVWLRRRLNDAPVEITISLLTPFAAYLPADRPGLSGVLATLPSEIDRWRGRNWRSVMRPRSLPAPSTVHVTDDIASAERLRGEWEEGEGGVELVLVESPFRSLTGPLLAYTDALQETHPTDTITVVLREFVPSHWWEHLLHNHGPGSRAHPRAGLGCGQSADGGRS